MKEFTFTIRDANGIHARPAGLLVNCAKKFASDVKARTAAKEVDGKRLLSMMSLGATQGTEITFRVEGEDEETACAALMEICKEHLGYEGR